MTILDYHKFSKEGYFEVWTATKWEIVKLVEKILDYLSGLHSQNLIDLLFLFHEAHAIDLLSHSTQKQ